MSLAGGLYPFYIVFSVLLCIFFMNVNGNSARFPHYLSDVCRKNSTCDGDNEVTNDKTCHCDPLCHVMEDCCVDAAPYRQLLIPFNKSDFSCVDLEGFGKLPGGFGVSMINKCPETWTHEDVKKLCVEAANHISYLLGRPVSQRIKGTNQFITYRNMYCAQCNGVYDYEIWQKDQEKYRKCHMHTVIKECPDTAESNLVKNCTDGPVNYAIDRTRDYRMQVYRNGYCALCNNVKNESISCETAKGSALPPPYDYLVLIRVPCAENELYDPGNARCHRIVCHPPATVINKRCVPSLRRVSQEDNIRNELGQNSALCHWIEIEKKDYEIRNDSNGETKLYHIDGGEYYDQKHFLENGSEIYVCVNWDEKNTKLASIIGLVISMIALLATLTVYCIFRKQLCNRPGMITVSFIISLLTAQLLFIIASLFQSIKFMCVAVAVLTHFSFLMSFCWTNVLSFDLLMTFCSFKKNRKLTYYYIYTICVPLALVAAGLAMQFVSSDPSPQYGRIICWISSTNGLIVYFLIPLAFFTLFNMITFGLTVAKILKENRDGSMARENKDSRWLALLFLKLSLTIGLTWVLGFLAHFTPQQLVFSYLFSVCNTLLGLYVAICFLCTKRMRTLLKCSVLISSTGTSRPTSSTNVNDITRRQPS